MSKTINVHEACVVTHDDKGNLSLVGKAKEALTTLNKNKVSVNIILCDSKKEDLEKFLNENNVPFTSIHSKGEEEKSEDGKEKKADVTIMPSSMVITLNDDWKWCLDDIANRLWGAKKKKAPMSEQEQMDDAFKRCICWAKPQKKSAENSIMPG